MSLALDERNFAAYTGGMETVDIQVIYQDHYLLIVNKQAGVVIHPTYKHANGTMWDTLLAYLLDQGGENWQPPPLPDLPEWSRAPLPIQEMLRSKRLERFWREEGLLARPCLLHRIDKDTSGIVALARTERSRRHIVRQFYDHSITKRYLAVVQKGAPAWARPQATLAVTRCLEDGEINACDLSTNLEFAVGEEYLLDGPLQRDPLDRRRCIVGSDGQHALTRLKVLALENELVFLDVYPLTGRTHQIRAHLAAAGYAIVGDRVYAPMVEAGSPAAGLTRQFLHAYSLTLRRYPDNDMRTFVAPLAADLAMWLRHFCPLTFFSCNIDYDNLFRSASQESLTGEIKG